MILEDVVHFIRNFKAGIDDEDFNDEDDETSSSSPVYAE